MEITEVKFEKTRARKPNPEKITKIIRKKQENGEQLHKLKTNVFYDQHNGTKEYLVTLIFKKQETNPYEDYFSDGGEWTTEELQNELE